MRPDLRLVFHTVAALTLLWYAPFIAYVALAQAGDEVLKAASERKRDE